MKIGYMKIGRAMSLTPTAWGAVGGDNEPKMLLDHLLKARPEDEFVILSPCKDDTLPDRVTNPWLGYKSPPREGGTPGNRDDVVRHIYQNVVRSNILECDAVIVWTGQHGSTSNRIPKIGEPDALTSPLESSIRYAAPQILGLNAWRYGDLTREEIWLCPEVRNFVKARDLIGPLRKPILSQLTLERAHKHYQWGLDIDWPGADEYGPDPKDPGILSTKTGQKYKYAGLELCGVTQDLLPWSEDDEANRVFRFGVIANQTRDTPTNSRRELAPDWFLAPDPAYLHGSWTSDAQEELGRTITPLKWAEMNDLIVRTKYSVTTPTCGQGWPTLKAWENWTKGVVLFFHPAYDAEFRLLSPLEDPLLWKWLRVGTAKQMQEHMQIIDEDPALYQALRHEMHVKCKNALADLQIVREINERIDHG